MLLSHNCKRVLVLGLAFFVFFAESMSLKPPVYLDGLSALETTETNETKTVSLLEYLAFYLLLGVVKCHRLSVAELLQTTLKRNGEWGSPAGVIPAHVHCFASVDVLGIVSAEFLSRAVTSADRRDLPLALLLFRQVFLQRKQLQLVSSLDAHNTDVPLKTEGKNIAVWLIPGKGEAFDRLVKVKGDLRQN